MSFVGNTTIMFVILVVLRGKCDNVRDFRCRSWKIQRSCMFVILDVSQGKYDDRVRALLYELRM